MNNLKKMMITLNLFKTYNNIKLKLLITTLRVAALILYDNIEIIFK